MKEGLNMSKQKCILCKEKLSIGSIGNLCNICYGKMAHGNLEEIKEKITKEEAE